MLEQEVTCPECEHVQVVTTTIEQPLSFTASTFTYAQKVFPFLGKFGVGTFGAGQVANKTMHFAIRELEASLKKNKGGYTKVSAVARRSVNMYMSFLSNLYLVGRMPLRNGF